MNNGPYIPERGAGLTPQDFPNLPSGPALGFNSCSLCGHGGASGSILARIREYVTFYANSDADLSDDMAIGRQEVSKSVMEILNEAEPVPAPLTKERLDALIESVYSRLPLGTTHEVGDSMILLRNAILGGAPVEPVPPKETK